MTVEFTVLYQCDLDPEDAKAIESGEMTVDDIDWYYYAQNADMDLISIAVDG